MPICQVRWFNCCWEMMSNLVDTVLFFLPDLVKKFFFAIYWHLLSFGAGIKKGYPRYLTKACIAAMQRIFHYLSIS